MPVVVAVASDVTSESISPEADDDDSDESEELDELEEELLEEEEPELEETAEAFCLSFLPFFSATAAASPAATDPLSNFFLSTLAVIVVFSFAEVL